MARGRPYRLGPPSSGFYAVTSPLLSPDKTLCSGRNVFVRRQDHSISVRPGFHTTNTISSLSNPIIAGVYFADETWNRVLIAVTSDNQWYASINEGSFTDISNSSLIREINYTSFVPFFYDSHVWIHACNGETPVIRWNTSQSEISEIADSPVLYDMTLCAGRIIGIDAVNFSIRWSAVNNPSVWPSNAYFVLPGMGRPVAIKSLTKNVLVVFTETDIYLIYPYGNTDATAFRFEYFGTSSPPVSIQVISNFSNVIYYLTVDGTVYFFDGSQIRKISLPIENITCNMSLSRSWVTSDTFNKYIFVGFPLRGETVIFAFDVEMGIWNPPWVIPYEVWSCCPAIVEYGVVWSELSTWTWQQVGLKRWEEFNPKAIPTSIFFSNDGKVLRLAGMKDGDADISWNFAFNPIVSDPSSMFIIDMVEVVTGNDLAAPVTVRLGTSFDLTNPVTWEDVGTIQTVKSVTRSLDSNPVRVIVVECSGNSHIVSPICLANVYVYEKKILL